MHDLQTAIVKITVVIRDLQTIKQLIEPFLLKPHHPKPNFSVQNSREQFSIVTVNIITIRTENKLRQQKTFDANLKGPSTVIQWSIIFEILNDGRECVHTYNTL